jgi:hypothetical protein
MEIYKPTLQEYVVHPPLWLEYLIEECDSLEIAISDSNQRILSLKFPYFVAYRRYFESDAIVLINKLSSQGVIAKYFYYADKSEYLNWFNHERAGPHNFEVLHFLFAGSDEIIDVLTPTPPSISVAIRTST